MIFGKLIDSQLEYAPNNLNIVMSFDTDEGQITQDMQVFNPTDEQYISAGYKPIEIADMPNIESEYQAIPVYVESDNKIIQEWEVKQNQNSEPPIEEQILALQAQLQALYERVQSQD